MQFRKAGNKIQILAYAGYSKEKRRSVVQVIGTLDRYSPSLTDELKNKLTVEQQKEVTDWIDQRRKADDLAGRRAAVSYLDSSIKIAVDSLTNGDVTLSDDQAARLYDAMAALQKALKKAGHRKPARPAASPAQVADPAQGAIPFPPLAEAGERSDAVCDTINGSREVYCGNPQRTTVREGQTYLAWRCDNCGGTGVTSWD